MMTVNSKRLLTLIFVTVAFGFHAFSQGGEPLRAFMQAKPSQKNAVQYGNNPKTGRFIQSDDARIYYEVYGKGKPLVILHKQLLRFLRKKEWK